MKPPVTFTVLVIKINYKTCSSGICKFTDIWSSHFVTIIRSPTYIAQKSAVWIEIKIK